MLSAVRRWDAFTARQSGLLGGLARGQQHKAKTEKLWSQPSAVGDCSQLGHQQPEMRGECSASQSAASAAASSALMRAIAAYKSGQRPAPRHSSIQVTLR